MHFRSHGPKAIWAWFKTSILLIIKQAELTFVTLRFNRHFYFLFLTDWRQLLKCHNSNRLFCCFCCSQLHRDWNTAFQPIQWNKYDNKIERRDLCNSKAMQSQALEISRDSYRFNLKLYPCWSVVKWDYNRCAKPTNLRILFPSVPKQKHVWLGRQISVTLHD